MKKAFLIPAICAGQVAYVAAQTPQKQTPVVPSVHRHAATPVQFPEPMGPPPVGIGGPIGGPSPGLTGPGPMASPPYTGWLRNANTDLYSTLPPGWPSVGVTRRDYPHPDPNAQPRDAGIEVRVPPLSRVFIDDEEIQCKEGKYRFAPTDPLIPGNPYAYRVRVESQNELGMLVVRAVTVYLRLGRITVLTFE